jgi:acetyltransferase-like isoleucine patch superfamily enzyme
MIIKRLINILQMKYASPIRRAELVKIRAGGVKLGNNCEVYPGVSFGSEPYLIDMGNNVRLTKGVTFITHDGGIWTLRNLGLLEGADIFGVIKVGDNVHIGINSIIMPGVNIGSNCIIGCGAVVTKDIPDNSIAVGVPAKVIQSINEYYAKHKETCDFTKYMEEEEKRQYLSKKFSLK